MSFSIDLTAEEQSVAENYARLHSISLAEAFKKGFFEFIRIEGENAAADPFYSEANMKYLDKVTSEIDSGMAKLHEHELIED